MSLCSIFFFCWQWCSCRLRRLCRLRRCRLWVSGGGSSLLAATSIRPVTQSAYFAHRCFLGEEQHRCTDAERAIFERCFGPLICSRLREASAPIQDTTLLVQVSLWLQQQRKPHEKRVGRRHVLYEYAASHLNSDNLRPFFFLVLRLASVQSWRRRTSARGARSCTRPGAGARKFSGRWWWR